MWRFFFLLFLFFSFCLMAEVPKNCFRVIFFCYSVSLPFYSSFLMNSFPVRRRRHQLYVCSIFFFLLFSFFFVIRLSRRHLLMIKSNKTYRKNIWVVFSLRFYFLTSLKRARNWLIVKSYSADIYIFFPLFLTLISQLFPCIDSLCLAVLKLSKLLLFTQ